MTDLRDRLIKWLEAERASAASAMASMGIQTRSTTWKPVTRLQGEGSLRTESEAVQVNSYAIAEIARRIDGRPRPQRPAAEVHAEYGDRCWVSGGTSHHSFERDPVAWVDEAILEPYAHTYLARLDDLSVSAADIAGACVDELLRFLGGDVVWSHTDVPLGGVSVDLPIVRRGVTLRPLTPEELGEMHGSEFELLRKRRPLILAVESVMLEVVEERPKTDQRRVTTAVQRIILGLQLLGFDPCGSGVLQQRDLPVSVGTLGQPMVLPSMPSTTRTCTESDFDAALALAERIPPASIDEPAKPHEVALHRFQQGCADRTATDALVDFVIALEAVLLPRDSVGDVRFQGELRFRFGLHGARLTNREDRGCSWPTRSSEGTP